jgi:hypothetical protein
MVYDAPGPRSRSDFYKKTNPRMQLLFVYEPVSVQDDAREKFMSVVLNWSRLKRDNKISEIFGAGVGLSPLILNQCNMAFTVKFTILDESWKPSAISSEDLSFALELDPSEWTIWRLL